MSYRCPSCHKSTGFWRSITISGWHSIDSDLKPSGQREADWSYVDEEFDGGCADCGWEGAISSLEKVGIDGEELPFVHPNQQEIDA